EVGAGSKRGLDKSSNPRASIPRCGYRSPDGAFRVAELPPTNALLATANAKRSNDEIALAMTNQMKWIEQVMEKSGLEAAGPMRIVTTDFGADSYAFDVVQPLRRNGTGPAQAGDGEGEGEDEGGQAEAVADAAAAAEPLERLDVVLEGDRNPVFYVQIPAMKVATTTYTGPSPALALVRDQVRAWALVRGH